MIALQQEHLNACIFAALTTDFFLQLHYLRLPKEISEDYVILMDSTVSTGAAALMAVRVLLVGPVLVRLSAYLPLCGNKF